MPFILKAGKALNERKVEIRVQMRPTVANLWQEENPEALRNELVVSYSSCFFTSTLQRSAGHSSHVLLSRHPQASYVLARQLSLHVICMCAFSWSLLV